MLSIPELQHSHHTVCSLQLQQVLGKVAGQHSSTASKQTQPCLEHSVCCPAEVEGVAFKRFDAGPVKLSEGARTVSAQHRAVVQDQARCISLLTACCVHRPLAGRTGVRTSIPLRSLPLSVHCHSLFIAAMCKTRWDADKGACISSCGHTIWADSVSLLSCRLAAAWQPRCRAAAAAVISRAGKAVAALSSSALSSSTQQ